MHAMWIIIQDVPLEYGDVVVNLSPMPLGNTLGNPHNVSALLLLQLDVGIEHAEMKLIQEGQLIEFHLQTHNPHFIDLSNRLLTWKEKIFNAVTFSLFSKGENFCSPHVQKNDPQGFCLLGCCQLPQREACIPDAT